MSLTTLETGVGTPADAAWNGTPNVDANIIETLKAIALKPVPGPAPSFPLEFSSIKYCKNSNFAEYATRSEYFLTITPSFTQNTSGSDLTVTLPAKSIGIGFYNISGNLWELSLFSNYNNSDKTYTVHNNGYYQNITPDSSTFAVSGWSGAFLFYNNSNTLVFACSGYNYLATNSQEAYHTAVICDPTTLLS